MLPAPNRRREASPTAELGGRAVLEGDARTRIDQESAV